MIGDIGGTNARFQVWEVEDKSNPSSAKMTFEKVCYSHVSRSVAAIVDLLRRAPIQRRH